MQAWLGPEGQAEERTFGFSAGLVEDQAEVEAD